MARRTGSETGRSSHIESTHQEVFFELKSIANRTQAADRRRQKTDKPLIERKSTKLAARLRGAGITEEMVTMGAENGYITAIQKEALIKALEGQTVAQIADQFPVATEDGYIREILNDGVKQLAKNIKDWKIVENLDI